ncbi:hypothetical protein nbrc107696_29920 [Gordonia spumicola]|uniref:Pyrrolo-quinoline quinone n=1 Tax=Gordonia spumicola TaxID=589161 RepID=A0A7I9VB00_9ACTN|nr:hypothetical protein [Gordonia spumicola]GEE02546.1 hypothetical protein nbrc107696_29920 [Gordonia spumicola]
MIDDVSAASAARGVGVVTGVATIVTGVWAIVGRAAVETASGADVLVLTISVASIIVAGVAATVLLVPGRAVRDWMRAGLGALLVVGVLAYGFATTSLVARRPGSTYVDETSSTVFAAATGACALVTVGAAYVALGRDSRGRRATLRWAIPAALLTAIIVTTSLTMAVGASRDRIIDGPVVGDSVASPDDPTSIDRVAFRIRSVKPQVWWSTAGLVLVDADVVTAYHGATGRVLWTYEKPDVLDGEVRVINDSATSTVVLAGSVVSMGLDAVTGRVLWRSARSLFGGSDWDSGKRVVVDDEPGGAARVRFGDPRTGRTAFDETMSCMPAYASQAHDLVLSSCDDRRAVRVIDMETGRQRDVRLSGTLDDSSWASALGNGFVAVGTGRDAPYSVSVVDTRTATEVDHFTSDLVPISASPSGILVMDQPQERMRGDGRDVRIRDVRAHRSSLIGLGSLRARSHEWFGDTLLVASGSDGFAVVDPHTRAVTRHADVCTPDQYSSARTSDLYAVPGAMLVFCSNEGYLPYTMEIVGLN